MIAPRLGLAWDMTGDARNIVRGGGGLFYAPTYMSIFAQSYLFNGGNPDKAFAVQVTDPVALRNAFQTDRRRSVVCAAGQSADVHAGADVPAVRCAGQGQQPRAVLFRSGVQEPAGGAAPDGLRAAACVWPCGQRDVFADRDDAGGAAARREHRRLLGRRDRAPALQQPGHAGLERDGPAVWAEVRQGPDHRGRRPVALSRHHGGAEHAAPGVHRRRVLHAVVELFVRRHRARVHGHCLCGRERHLERVQLSRTSTSRMCSSAT